MTFKLVLISLILTISVCTLNASVVQVNERSDRPGGPSTLELRPEIVPNTQPNTENQPRRNSVQAVRYVMRADALQSSLDRIQFLLDYNTKDLELLREVMYHFRKYEEYDWHVTFEHTAAGEVPVQYAYYRFDRNNTELFVGGYRRCY